MDKVLLAYSDKFYNVLSGENCEEIYNGIDYDELEKNFVEYDPNDILEGEQWFLVDLNKISTIFHNILYLYKEATNKEVKEFFDVKLEKIAILNFDISKVSKANRKKLGLSLDNNFIGKEKKYSECIDEFKIDLEIKDSIVQINSNNDLSIFLDVLDENYFHSYVSKENRLARKTRKIL